MGGRLFAVVVLVATACGSGTTAGEREPFLCVPPLATGHTIEAWSCAGLTEEEQALQREELRRRQEAARSTTTSTVPRPHSTQFEGTVTAVHGLSPTEALQRLFPDAAIGPTDLDTAQAWLHGKNGGVHLAVPWRDWAVIMEENDFRGITEARLATLSAGTRTVAINHITDGGWCHFTLAEDGRIRRDFGQEHYNGPYTVGGRVPEEAGLDLGTVEHSWSALRTLFTRLVGADAFALLADTPPGQAVAVDYLH